MYYLNCYNKKGALLSSVLVDGSNDIVSSTCALFRSLYGADCVIKSLL